MDTGKIIKVIDDIVFDEQTFSAQASLDRILSIYATTPAAVNEEKEKILQDSLKSRISKYPISDYKTLEKLNAQNHFGPGLYKSLNDILSLQAHEIPASLQSYISARATKLASLIQLRTTLIDLGFETRALSGDDYEIGLSLPNGYMEIEKTEKVLDDLGKFLNALSNASGSQRPLNIKYVSNGSIEFFIEVGVELAKNFDIVLDYALKIYALIEAAKGIKKGIKNYKNKDRWKDFDKTLEAQKKEDASKLIDEMINDLNITGPDDKNRVSILFKTFLKHIESGVGAEVRTPEIDEPAVLIDDASADQKTKYTEAKKIYDMKIDIDRRNRQIFVHQQNNFYGLNTKFLDNVDDTTSNK